MSVPSDEGKEGPPHENPFDSAEASQLRAFFAQHHPELRRLARLLIERSGGALRPTDLVNEAFVQLARQGQIAAKGRTFFLACVARECRHILVDELRRERAVKRGGPHAKVTIDTNVPLDAKRPFDLVEVNDLIERLGTFDSRLSAIVDMIVFGNLTIAECAEAMGVSKRQIDKLWAAARAWLRKEMRP